MTGFGGVTFSPTLDGRRLGKQLLAVRAALRDGEWHSLADLARVTKAPEASVSARVRDLRKVAFGGWVVERRRVGDPKSGCYEYRLVSPAPVKPEQLELGT